MMNMFQGLMSLIFLFLFSACSPSVIKIGTDLSTAKKAVASGDINMLTDEKESALHYCARKGDIEVARYLLEHGASINLQNTWGSTPLLESITHENKELSLYLINAGADINIKNKWNVSPLLSAASFGNIEVLRVLHSKGADIDIINKSSDTPLMLAAKGGHAEVVVYLLKNGADKSARNKEHHSALDIAKEVENVKIISLLKIKNEGISSYNTPLNKKALLIKSSEMKKKIFTHIQAYIQKDDLKGLLEYTHTLQ